MGNPGMGLEFSKIGFGSFFYTDWVGMLICHGVRCMMGTAY